MTIGEAEKKYGGMSLIFPDGLVLPGLGAVFVGGLTFSAWCAMMLTVPTVFGSGGIQIKASGDYFGLGGEVEVG